MSETLPVVTTQQEDALKPVLFFDPLYHKRHNNWASEERAYENLSAGRKIAIETQARRLGVHLLQAVHLRTALLFDKCAWKFDGSAANVAGSQFEDECKAILLGHGVQFYSEDQQKQIQRNESGFTRLGPTPDFLIRGSLTLNGKTCNWIEVKGTYGCGSADITKETSIKAKTLKQIKKYTDKFGPGAVIFRYGHSEQFRCLVKGLVGDSVTLICLHGSTISIGKPYSRRSPEDDSVARQLCDACGIYLEHSNPPADFKGRHLCCLYCAKTNGNRHGERCEWCRKPDGKRRKAS